MKYTQIIYGVATYIPGAYRYLAKPTGGTDSARYCYSVWLRHLVMAEKNGLNSQPKVVAELGPGDSLGIGLAALISGCDKYFAFDVVEFANAKDNIKIFDELVLLFRDKTNIPGEDEFPLVKPYLGTYNYPDSILTEERMSYALDASRLERIRESINYTHNNNSVISYRVPWFEMDVIEEETVDMIYSQAVLEHVEDLTNTYKAMQLWLKPTGYVSHQIDFKSHGTDYEWNGHWTYSDLSWWLIKGKRPYLLNREPHSSHIKLLEKEFKIVCDKTITSKSNLTEDALAPKYRTLSDDDLTTSGAFIQALKLC